MNCRNCRNCRVRSHTWTLIEVFQDIVSKIVLIQAVAQLHNSHTVQNNRRRNKQRTWQFDSLAVWQISKAKQNEALTACRQRAERSANQLVPIGGVVIDVISRGSPYSLLSSTFESFGLSNIMAWSLSFPYPPSKEGYWAPVTSTLNWCEEVRYPTPTEESR